MGSYSDNINVLISSFTGSYSYQKPRTKPSSVVVFTNVKEPAITILGNSIPLI